LIGVAASPARGQVLDSYFSQTGKAAGDIPADQSRQQALDEYSPLGVRLGSMTISPSLNESIGFDSDVNGLALGGSPMIDTNGSLVARSEASTHTISAQLTVDDRRYTSVSSQDSTSWTASLGGTYDFGRDQVGLTYNHLSLVQTPNAIGSATLQPLPYRTDLLTGSYTKATTGALSFLPSFDVRNYSFDAVPVPGTHYDETYRNRVEAEESLVTRYELAPDRDLLLALKGTEIRYGKALTGTPLLDSNGGSVLIGIEYSATDVFRYRALAGYQVRQYVSGVYGSISAPIAEVSVTWAPSRLTTAVFSLRRDIDDSLSEAVAGITYLSGKIDVTHELRRDVILDAYAQIQRADSKSNPLVSNVAVFAGGGNQTLYQAGGSAKWLINRNLTLKASFAFTRSIADTNRSYTEAVGMLTIGFAL
jgi:hypothetical protein